MLLKVCKVRIGVIKLLLMACMVRIGVIYTS